MKKLLREPLFHFLVLGASLFGLYYLVSGNRTRPEQIVIDDNDLNHIASVWELQWNRPPTEQELAGLIESFVQQEVLFREGRRMGLDQDDEVIKRRVAQKMDFLSGDVSAMLNPPTGEELANYFQKHAAAYQMPAVYSFYQVGLRPEKHSDIAAHLNQLKNKLSPDHPETAGNLGDPMPFPFWLKDWDSLQISQEMGGELAAELSILPLHQWVGPVHSGFGQHLVFMVSKTNSRIPTLAEVEKDVVRDYQYNKEKDLQHQLYGALRNKYDIRIETSRFNPTQSKAILANIKSNAGEKLD